MYLDTILKFGSHPLTTCNLSQVHEIIEISFLSFSAENTDLRAFYEQGLSVNDIANRLGKSYSTVRDLLAQQGVTFRSAKSVSFSGKFRHTFKNSAPPPFGFCYLDGRLEKDPREFPILQIIEKQHQLGKTPTQIARFLADRKFKTRHGRPWKQPNVFNIIQRIKKGGTNRLKESL